MKQAGISAREALAAIERERRRHREDPNLTWPEHEPSTPRPGMCPNDSCIHEPRQGVIIPTPMRVGPDGFAHCPSCGGIDRRRSFPYQPPDGRRAVLPDWLHNQDDDG